MNSRPALTLALLLTAQAALADGPMDTPALAPSGGGARPLLPDSLGVGCTALRELAFAPEYVRLYAVDETGTALLIDMLGGHVNRETLPLPESCVKAGAVYSFGGPICACTDGEKLMIADVRIQSITPALFDGRYLDRILEFMISIGSPKVATLTSRETADGVTPVVAIHVGGGEPLLSVDVASPELLAIPAKRRGGVLYQLSLALSAKGDRIATSHAWIGDYGLKIWDVPDKAGVKLVRSIPIRSPRALAFNPDGNLIAVASLEVLPAEAGPSSTPRPAGKRTKTRAPAADKQPTEPEDRAEPGRWIVTVFDVATGQELHRAPVAEPLRVFTLSPKGDRIAYLQAACGLAIADTDSGAVLQVLK